MIPNPSDENHEPGLSRSAATEAATQSSSLPISDEGRLIARALVSLRGDRTRAEVARGAGVDAAEWEYYESGRCSLTLEQRVPLARGLGVTVYELEHTLWRERAAELRGLEEQVAPEPSEPLPQVGGTLSKRLQLKAALARITDGLNSLIDECFLEEV